MRNEKHSTPRAPLPVIDLADDPHSLYHRMRPFLEWMRVRNYSQATVEHGETYLRAFITWCDERGVTRPQEVTRPVLERYQRYLFLYRRQNGEALSGRSQHMRLVQVRVTHPGRLERREEADRIEQARPNRLLKRVYGQKDA